MLRCNRCGNPICVKCAVRTPVGYRCKNCVRNQQQTFYTAGVADYVIAALITLPLAALAQFVGSLLSWFVVFVAPLAGGLIAEAVRRATGRRRGQYTWLVVAVCCVIGALPSLMVSALPALYFLLGRATAFSVLGAVFSVLNLVLLVGTAISRLRFGK